ncbi:TonB-dependent receptor [Sphingomonas sp. Root710]|uniref:TonB-dependent receptor n=1 Tax=Sphingomonas sp. Root710 TaxID=1736594 RepID=UPI001F33E69D|nr:TonB-dependent receptor [Sphingomonas sp. Root710]
MKTAHLRPVRRMMATIFLASTCLATSSAAFAQTAAEGSSDGEIIVTATKRNESIQKVPISLQALGTETLAQHQVSNLDDYVKLLPSVSFQTYGPSQSDISIRGVSTGGINLPGGSLPTVGIYLDEVPVSTIGAMLDVHAYDLARVEALSGPQGTLYGASSLAGTIRMITNKPAMGKFEGGYDVNLNKFGKGNVGGSAEAFVNIPVGDAAAVRAVGWYVRDGGYIDNTLGSRTYTLSDADPTNDLTVTNAAYVKKDFNEADTYGGRLALGIELDDNWTIEPKIQGQYQKAKGAFNFDPVRAGDLKVHEFAPDLNIDKWYLASLTIQGKVGDFDLTYAGGYLKRKINNDQDYSYYTVYYDNITGYTNFPDGNGGFLDPTQRYHNDQSLTKQSHEVRISSDRDKRFSFIAGLFYQRQSNNNFADYYVPGLGATGYPVTFGDDIFTTDTHIVARDYAAFGEAYFKITDDLTLTGGIRGFKARNTLEGFSGFASNATGAGCPLPITPGGCQNIIADDGTPGKTYKESGETHKVSLAWQIDTDKMVYATYSTGFRPGGNNRRPGINPYKADTIDNFELGWKTSLLDRKLRFNGSVYYMEWNKLQYTLAPIGSVGVVNIYNSGDARIYGAEISAAYSYGGLTLSGSGTFTDAKLTTDFCAINAQGNSDCSLGGAPAAPKGTRLTVQPKFKGTATARYDFELAGNETFVQGSVLQQGAARQFLATADDAAVGRTKAFTTFDFSAGMSFGELKVEAYIQNAFDKRGIASKNTFCAPTYCGQYARSYPIKPQLFGMKVSQRF